MKNVLWFEDIDSEDTENIGEDAKNLGTLKSETDVPIRSGFTSTKEAYTLFMHESGVRDNIETLLRDFDSSDVSELHRVGKQARSHIEEADMPEDLREDLLEYYRELEEESEGEEFSLAVKAEPSEDIFDESERFWNVSSEQELLKFIKKCYASLFSNSAISHREKNGISHFEPWAAVTIQETCGSDADSSGKIKTGQPSENLITVESTYGIRDNIESSDEFTVFKKNLGIIEKKLGNKLTKTVKDGNKLVEKDVTQYNREKFSITENKVKELSKYALTAKETLEEDVEVEWVLDSQENALYVTGIETDEGESSEVLRNHSLEEDSEAIVEGETILQGIAKGKAKVISSPNNVDRFNEGEILVADSIHGEWQPLLEKADGIVLNSERSEKISELDIPVLDNTENATSKIGKGENITIDCSSSQGKVLEGELEYTVKVYDTESLPVTDTEVKLELESSDEAVQNSGLPIDGVGLLKVEDILANIGSHPLHLIEEGKDNEVVEELFSEIGKIGAAFYPRQVNVRLSDFGSDEYRKLEGGENHEDDEENPLMGFRGASRHSHETFEEAFELECKTIRRCIDELGLDNITVTVPFCRTVQEGKDVRAKMKEYGLDSGDIDVYVMIETPASVLEAGELAEVFDGLTIGTEDLTQLTLGVDRENEKVGNLFDERAPAVKKSVKQVIRKAHERGKPVEISGDAASVHDDYTEFLVENFVDSISVSPDKALETTVDVSEHENERDEMCISAEDIGSVAGEVYDALNEKGKSTANRLIDHVDETFDPKTVNQALGWLAKEGKIEVEVKKDGETKYKLD